MRWSDIFQAILVFFARYSFGKSPTSWFRPLGHSDALSRNKAHVELLAHANVPVVKRLLANPTVTVKASDINNTEQSKIMKVMGRLMKNYIGKYSGINKIISIVSGFTRTNSKKKVLILMCDTGGGHRASAQAIDKAFSEQFPGRMDVQIMDLWSEHGKWPFDGFVPVYRYVAKYPILWRAMYAYGIFPPTKLFTEVYSHVVCYDHFKNAIESSNPDMVVSVHPLCQHIPIPIVQRMNEARGPKKERIPFVTIVTDLGGAHPTWFDKRCDRVYVASEAIRNEAIGKGIAPEKIALYGLPIRPSFWKAPKPKGLLRKELGLKKSRKTVLLMGGGDGVGGLEKIAIEVANKLGVTPAKSQMVVVCGHNKDMVNKLSVHDWPRNVNVMVKGFCNNVDELMSASDCLVTKAGPGTIAEAMIRGLPIILSSFLPGQEAGNVPFVVDGGFGVYTGNKPTVVAEAVKSFFSDNENLQRMSRLARAQSHQDATTLIARDMAGMLDVRANDQEKSPAQSRSGRVSRSRARSSALASVPVPPATLDIGAEALSNGAVHR